MINIVEDITKIVKCDKNERFITFKKTDKYPDLKDTFNLPDKINVKDLKSTWVKAVEDLGGDFTTKNIELNNPML